ncbi:MAG: type VII toxin-antitoxin system HepT family RNase toxin [Myxococcota bacterium]
MLGYVSRIERFRDVDRSRFVADPDTHHLAERYLQLAVESALDIANHIIADRGYEAPETYRDAFAILAKHEMVPEDLARRLQGWAGFRNILVHAYLDVDHGIAWDALRDLQDLRELATIAAKLL